MKSLRLSLLLLALALLSAIPARATTFYFTWYADTASASTVKLIQQGKVFSDVTGVYTLTWNATDQIYQAALDDATFVPDYYRIEEGSGNIVVEQFYTTGKVLEGDHVEDIFLSNSVDDIKRGNLYIRPASGVDNIDLRVDNSSSTIVTITATDTTTGTTNKTIQFRGADIDVQTIAGADIPITGIANSSTTNSAVTRASRDSLAGSGWTWNGGLNTIMQLRDDVDALTGTGTFAANDSLFLSGGGGRGILSVQWAFDPTGVNDSIEHVEIYYGTAPVPGYSQSGAATMSSATLTLIRSTMFGVVYPPRGTFSLNIPAIENFYVIAVAFDHTSPTPLVWGSNQVLVTGNDDPLDSTTPIIGDASSLVDAVEQLANEVANVISTGGSGTSTGTAAKVWYASAFEGAPAGLPTETTWYQAAAASSVRVYFTFYKDATYNTLRLRFQSSHDAASKDGTFYLGSNAGTTTKTYTHSATPDTWQDNVLTQDISSLAEGIYQGSLSLADGSSSTLDTLFIRRVIAESYNE